MCNLHWLKPATLSTKDCDSKHASHWNKSLRGWFHSLAHLLRYWEESITYLLHSYWSTGYVTHICCSICTAPISGYGMTFLLGGIKSLNQHAYCSAALPHSQLAKWYVLTHLHTTLTHTHMLTHSPNKARERWGSCVQRCTWWRLSDQHLQPLRTKRAGVIDCCRRQRGRPFAPSTPGVLLYCWTWSVIPEGGKKRSCRTL